MRRLAFTFLAWTCSYAEFSIPGLLWWAVRIPHLSGMSINSFKLAFVNIKAEDSIADSSSHFLLRSDSPIIPALFLEWSVVRNL
jgi:hypothetical protein